ncbi:L(+)-tartrate dehydratase subunit alpha [Tindallia californiensis]|uniref:L(+)-tartrate dehydratase subunit alpha n=1 Tax=Tindallia californiensis TaxID=159292 RepID=A0A1H3J1Y1_9FIRM|nr:L(+)-tartrate dehydratase subunit alpha [Tindallia californiensis]SDY33817.1 L(+)-tartrate dehydratase alpha subunit [Tindallia californiensis]
MTNSKMICEMTEIMARFISMTSKRLPDDVLKRLIELRELEDQKMAKEMYCSMFENLEKAIEMDRPICQDTGLINFFLNVGSKYPYQYQLKQVLREAVKKATTEAPLRSNAISIFDEENSGDNTGERTPFLHWDIKDESDEVEIQLYMTGGGSSMPGRATTLMPSEGYEGVVNFVYDTIVEKGINACPPLLVGVGIAGSMENAALLSKKAILRPLGSKNQNQKAAEMEKAMEEGINYIGFGPQGLSGKTSVMGVHLETAARHPATISVAVSVGCWVHRKGVIRFKKDGSYEILSHKGGL